KEVLSKRRDPAEMARELADRVTLGFGESVERRLALTRPDAGLDSHSRDKIIAGNEDRLRVEQTALSSETAQWGAQLPQPTAGFGLGMPGAPPGLDYTGKDASYSYRS